MKLMVLKRCSVHKKEHNRWEASNTLYRHFVFFHGGHLENHLKWRIGPKISSVNILILNKRGPMNNILPLSEDT